MRLKSPIPLFEKWGFHDLAIFTPPKIGKEKTGVKSDQPSAFSNKKMKLMTSQLSPKNNEPAAIGKKITFIN